MFAYVCNATGWYCQYTLTRTQLVWYGIRSPCVCIGAGTAESFGSSNYSPPERHIQQVFFSLSRLLLIKYLLFVWSWLHFRSSITFVGHMWHIYIVRLRWEWKRVIEFVRFRVMRMVTEETPSFVRNLQRCKRWNSGAKKGRSDGASKSNKIRREGALEAPSFGRIEQSRQPKRAQRRIIFWVNLAVVSHEKSCLKIISPRINETTDEVSKNGENSKFFKPKFVSAQVSVKPT